MQVVATTCIADQCAIAPHGPAADSTTLLTVSMHSYPYQQSAPCHLTCRPSPFTSCHMQPGEQAKYGGVFADMLRSSPALQAALQRVATVAQLRCVLRPASRGVQRGIPAGCPAAAPHASSPTSRCPFRPTHPPTQPLRPPPPLQPAGAGAAGRPPAVRAQHPPVLPLHGATHPHHARVGHDPGGRGRCSSCLLWPYCCKKRL